MCCISVCCLPPHVVYRTALTHILNPLRATHTNNDDNAQRWIAFQLLTALAQAHGAGVCHGDVKCENLLLTSWGWLFLADWAPYKPTYLPADNPADFSFFFDTGGRRRCYLAPERFFAGGPAAAIDAGAPLAPEMDVFAAGCCIGELLLDGRALFDLGQLLAYRRGDTAHAAALLAGAPDPLLAQLAAHMIQLRPGDRWPARRYLDEWPAAHQLFPPFMRDALSPFLDSLRRLDGDERVAAAAAALPELKRRAMGGGGGAGGGGSGGSPLGGGLPAGALPRSPAAAAAGRPAETGAAAGDPSSSSSRGNGGAGGGGGSGAALLDDVSALLSGTAAVRGRLGAAAGAPAAEDDGICLDDGRGGPGSAGGLGSPAAGASGIGGSGGGDAGGATAPPLAAAAAAAAPTTAAAASAAATPPAEEENGMVLVTAALCALLRGCQLPESRRACVALLHEAALLCDDATRLQRAVPYLLTQVSSDAAPAVRALALRCLVRLVASVGALPPGDAKAYRDYLLPSLSLLPHDADEAVRVEYALAAAHLAAAAHRHLLKLQFGGNGGGGGGGERGGADAPPGDAEAADAQGKEEGGDGGSGGSEQGPRTDGGGGANGAPVR